MERRSNKTGDSSLSDPPAPPKRVASGLTIDIPSIISGDGSGGVEPTRQEPALDKSMYAMLTSDFTEKTLTKTKEERKDIIVNPSPHSDSTSPTAPRGTPGKEQGAGFEESRTAPRDAFSTSSDDEEEGDEGAEDPMSIMKRVLKEAAQPKGFRLTWILYSMIFIVIAFFVMLLIQTTFTMNSALKTGGKQSVQALASSTVNNVKLTLYELDKLFDTVDLINSEENDDMSLPTPIASIIYSTLCTRLFGAPQNILNYEENSSTANWALPCNSAFKPPTVDLFKQAVYSKEIRLAGLSDNNTMAYRFGNLTSRSAVVLSKDLLGKGLFSNDVPKYSTGVLQSAFVGLFLAQWNNTTPSIVMHTLNEETASYADPQPTKEGERLQKAFNTYCQHTNEYTWYNVIRPKVFSDDEFDFDSENSSTFHPIPSPYQEFKGRWGLLSRSVLCVAVCIDDYDSICRPENPSTMWLVIDYQPSSMGQDAVQYVGIISIVALVIFSILAVFDYISITIPVDYLRDQLLRIVGPRRDHSSCFKRMVRWSYRLWLGDLKALIRTLHILRFCYEHNQKYVPEHILMRQANELYQNRSKLFLLYKMELRYDAGILEDDEESDNELVEDKPNERADSTMWTNLDNEMTTVSMQNSLNISNFREDLLSSPDPNISDNGDRDANPSNYLSSVKRGVKPPMTIKRSDEATVLCIQFVNIENAYSVNYNLAVKQHRRLMRYTLSQIRKYKGVIFHRTGDCMAVVWNGFNVCSAHTEKATECAISFAASFAPYREQGFQVGIVVHKGSFVCGVVEDSKEAFITAFGEAPSQAITLATLAAMQPYFGFIVTEPAKQALSSVYDFGVIDVIKMPAGTHSMYLFEIIGKKDKKATRADFLVQYTKAFTKFRNHEFHDSLEGIRQLRKNFPKQSDVLVHRLELLCQYYSRHKSDIPRPYVRAYPAWENYDQRAQITGPECYYGTPPGSAWQRDAGVRGAGGVQGRGALQ
ncbi:protein kinase [Angomonas deanei]|uniref:Adenylate and Guanylate cyclase catalytic domain containing protein, putative n=1 Tax=Angomonas deanei TaxID=59799 RepID=A0A7G2CNH8_9TRYP|nr:protein kinase [Angomonas deanei]CAD2220899.1 Adenylate and Guanylate cyclase catalytic domain containing protein, putative [Angomonas deanei]|eukprot:EPY21633.1 protein kinase [Angomonas deanei]